MERVPVTSSFPWCFHANAEKLSYTAPRLDLPTVCFTSHHSPTSHDSAPCTVQTTEHEMIPARVLGVTGAVRGTAGYKRDYWSRIGDRGSTVVKVLCYKSEGRWFDRSWYQWIFHSYKILPIALFALGSTQPLT